VIGWHLAGDFVGREEADTELRQAPHRKPQALAWRPLLEARCLKSLPGDNPPEVGRADWQSGDERVA
jgi:hypothetical protein